MFKPKWIEIIISIFLLSPLILEGQVLSGQVRMDGGDPLPFATIYIPKTGSGTTSNAEGIYSIKLEPGEYNVI